MKKQSKVFINRQRMKAFLMLLIISFSFIVIAPKPAQAQMIVTNPISDALNKVWDFLKKAYEKGGAAAFQTAVRSALNKIAYDTANWIGSGGEGQKPLFVTQSWGDYLTQIGDEAAGQFLEQAVANWQSANWRNDEKGSKLNEQCNIAYQSCLQGRSKCIRNCNLGDPACVDDCNNTYPQKTIEQCEAELISCAGVTTANDGTTASRQPSKTAAVCRPSSIEARLQIALGLVDHNRPKAPNCSASELIENWGNYYERMTAFKDPNFLNNFSNIFNPVSNDLGIYMILRANQLSIVNVKEQDAKTKLIADGGWIDLRDIAGNLTGLPGDAARRTELAQQSYINNMAQFSGDALIDAANVFLNQLALSSYNRLMSGLGKKASDSINSSNLSNTSSDPNIRYGEGIIKESAARIIEPNFTTRGDYNILVMLGMCMNSSNPGPTDCVIDDRLTQGITEKVTVAEAIKAGYLRNDWQFTTEYKESSYNLRNIQIMRKYRIVPLGWELAAQMDRKATLGDLISCFSATDEYNSYSPNFDFRNQAWCRGLVDPNWVLKAPLNYCAKQGYGSQTIGDIQIIPGSASNAAFLDTIQITRADNYCADDQTCINENSDGSCENYGYCLSERLVWNFDSQSCQAIDNTCSSFTNSLSGQKVSYLENTLDYANCNADSVGCKRYSLNGNYDVSSRQVSWSANPFSNAYFNSKLSGCSPVDEGCREMMRVKPSWRSNLVMGADFAYDNVGDSLEGGKINNYWGVWSSGSSKNAEIIDTSSLDGVSLGKAIKLDSSDTTIAVYSNNAVSLMPANLNILSGETYTLSADVYLISGEKIHAVLGNYDSVVETKDKEVWRHLSVTRSLKEKPLSEMSFQVVAYSGDSGEPISFAVRNIKLEMNSFDSGFSAYGAYKVYQKLIPNYLAQACYVSADPSNPDYRLKSDAPAACSNFARQCNLDEAGCDRYTEVSTGFSVAAQAITTDYCDASCNGYNLYVSRASYFYSPQAEKIIPKNSRSCNAQATGCAEFTNLDIVAAGGEGREYYTQLKQCIKPGGDCDDFYTWVGTEESGYQLKSFILKKDINGNPATTSNNPQSCNEAVFNLPPSDPAFNPDCRQYYNKNGQISYRLNTSTITCSENCNTYRLSENNIDTTVSQAQCVGSDKSWNNSTSVCYVCKNGGVWNAQHQACLYQAIPNEGKKCSAAQNGCREYNGNLGNNVRLTASNSFNNDTEGWEGQCGDAALHSNVASSNNGNSLLYDRGANYGGVSHETICDQASNVTWLDRFLGSANAAPASYIRRILGRSLTQGKSYSLKFTASSAADADVYFAFLNDNDEISYFNASDDNPTGSFTITGNNEWKTYELNLPVLDHAVDNKEALIIASNRDFYLDNLVLTEISNRYYLIKNTSQIPDVCYYDMLENYQGADYNLGCSLYKDRSNNNHNLRQFSKLCQDSAVGCELMIDTSSYSNYKPGLWKDLNNNGVCDSNESECMSVPGDRFFYAIYDPSKACNSADLGCSRLGEAVSSGNNLAWSDVFKRNNPNNYNQILCNADDADCEAWQYTDGRGMTYFKNPGNDVCVYRNSSNPENMGKAWFKAPVMRCDLNNNGVIDANEIGTKICSSAGDCAANRPCILDNNDYDCPVSYFKTFGYGGGGAQVPVPSESAATCTPAASGCTEYIDPISSFSANLVRDPGLESTSVWEDLGINSYQDIVVEPNSLYVFSVFSKNDNLAHNVRLTTNSGFFVLQEDNNLSTTASTTLTIPSVRPDQRFIFHSRNNTGVRVWGAHNNHIISLKKVIIDYQLQKNIDKTSCNGLVNTDNGCILFNERAIDGANGLATLSGAWNASASDKGRAPQLCAPGYCDANTLIKVRPDRTCASWLDCLTYTIDPKTNRRTCYALGECNSLNEQGECINFVSNTPSTTISAANFNINKLTGYSILDQYTLANMKEVGLNTSAHYDFEAASPTLHCEASGGLCIFDNNLHADSIVNSPNNPPTDYPAEGRAYLQVMAGYFISPHSKNAPISIQKGEDYYINFLVNTRGSGAKAKVSIYRPDDNIPTASPLWSATVSATDGWERKVLKIPGNVFPSSGNLNAVSLYLSVDTNSKEKRYVYFDDINIEPVLQIGPNQYAAKECRLYPSRDAISCSSKNNQVIRDGLVGYCLQHDAANKNVCLLWYPIDEISSNIKSARSQLGYQGAYPLNYCTEVNANFDLVEKRKAYYAGFTNYAEVKQDTSSYENDTQIDKVWFNCSRYNDSNNFSGWNNVNKSGIIFSGNCCEAGHSATTDAMRLFCGGDTNYHAVAGVVWRSSSADLDFMCIPKVNPLLVPSITRTVILYPNKNSRNHKCTITFQEGWGGYDGLKMWSLDVPAVRNKIDNFHVKTCEDVGLDNDLCLGGINEVKNHTPSVAVYDYDFPVTYEDGLKYVASRDADKVHYLTCNQFTQVVDSSGVNMAWADRTSISSIYPYETPEFFRDGSTSYTNLCYRYTSECLDKCECERDCDCDDPDIDTYNSCWGDCAGYPPGHCLEYKTENVDCDTLGAIAPPGLLSFNKYGRSRELIPFGAATFPDNFNIFASEAVKLRNQYSSSIDQKVFAGRPYGCKGKSCANIGFCSLNPNVYCIVDKTPVASLSRVNEISCGSSNGTCVPLWNGDGFTTDPTFKPENILKNIFLQSFDGYKFSKNTGTYLSTSTAAYRITSGSYRQSIASVVPPLSAGSHASTTFSTYWGPVYPKIDNVSLKFNGNNVARTGDNFDVKNPGIYILEFNTTIDPEQQPLKEIVIDWGGGDKQVLVNLDHKPLSNEPHRIYHYYSNPGWKKIGIKVFDNWGFFGVPEWN